MSKIFYLKLFQNDYNFHQELTIAIDFYCDHFLSRIVSITRFPFSHGVVIVRVVVLVVVIEIVGDVAHHAQRRKTIA